MATIEAQRGYVDKMFRSNGFVSVKYSLNPTDLDNLFGQFGEFLNLCDENGGEVYRDALAFKPTDPTAGSDYFVTSRRKGEVNPHSINPAPSTEDKDVAHTGPSSIARASHLLNKQGIGRMPNVMRKFLDTCVDVHEAAKSSVRPTLKALGLESAVLAPNPAEDQHVVRLLRYHGTDDDELAEPHFDRSVGTLAVHESHPGLYGAPGNNAQRLPLDIETFDNTLDKARTTPISHRPNEAKFFLGAGYNRLSDKEFRVNGPIPLLLHGVKNAEARVARFAVVVFMNPPAGHPGYSIPKPTETGASDIRQQLISQSNRSQYAD